MSGNLQAILRLVTDQRFARLGALDGGVNCFAILGSTFRERWHSAFLSWVLDPEGTHGLGTFPLRRFLALLVKPVLMGTKTDPLAAARLSTLGTLERARVAPNERDQKEFAIGGRRFDVFCSNIHDDVGRPALLLVEQKVFHFINATQCQEYADLLESKYPDHTRLLVCIAPRLALGGSIAESIGDERWVAIDYHTLNSGMLQPILAHPDIDGDARMIIAHYTASLRNPMNGEPVLQPEEIELAQRLFEEHRDAFRLIAIALSHMNESDLEQIRAAADDDGADGVPLRLIVDGISVFGQSVPDFFRACTMHAIKTKRLTPDKVPFKTGPMRYLISQTPTHSNGSPFVNPITCDGYVLEGNKSRSQAMKDMHKFISAMGCTIGVELAAGGAAG